MFIYINEKEFIQTPLPPIKHINILEWAQKTFEIGSCWKTTENTNQLLLNLKNCKNFKSEEVFMVISKPEQEKNVRFGKPFSSYIWFNILLDDIKYICRTYTYSENENQVDLVEEIENSIIRVG